MEGMPGAVAELARDAVEVVVDRGYMRVQRLWYAAVSETISCRLTQVGVQE